MSVYLSTYVSRKPYTIGNASFAVHPVAWTENDPEAAVKARQAAIQEAVDNYLNSHLETRNLNAFANSLAEDLQFFSVSDKEGAITFKVYDRATFLDGMQKFHFDNVTQVRNISTTPVEVDIKSYFTDESLIEALSKGSNYACKVECEQYRLGKGMGEVGEGWYKIEATVFFSLVDLSVSEDGKLHMHIQNIVQSDYLKNKLPAEMAVPAGAIKV